MKKQNVLASGEPIGTEVMTRGSENVKELRGMFLERRLVVHVPR